FAAGAGRHRADRAAPAAPAPHAAPTAVHTRTAVATAACQGRERKHSDYRSAHTHHIPPAGWRELDFSQLTNRNPPGASNLGSPGPGRICSCSSSILFLEQSQHVNAKSPSRRVRDSSITCTISLSVTGTSFL